MENLQCIRFLADAKKAKPGAKGNLIISAYMERVAKDKDGKPRGPKRRLPMGILPAVPFEVVAKAKADSP